MAIPMEIKVSLKNVPMPCDENKKKKIIVIIES